jgi:CheY-like chemotaxis protein
VSTRGNCPLIILVVDDVEETRDCTEQLLVADGYVVVSARSEADAITKSRPQCPNLILLSLGGPSAKAIATAQRIRRLTDLKNEIPAVIFCVDTVEEGAELEVANNVFATRPDNFDQLRLLIRRVLDDCRSRF